MKKVVLTVLVLVLVVGFAGFAQKNPFSPKERNSRVEFLNKL